MSSDDIYPLWYMIIRRMNARHLMHRCGSFCVMMQFSPKIIQWQLMRNLIFWRLSMTIEHPFLSSPGIPWSQFDEHKQSEWFIWIFVGEKKCAKRKMMLFSLEFTITAKWHQIHSRRRRIWWRFESHSINRTSIRKAIVCNLPFRWKLWKMTEQSKD